MTVVGVTHLYSSTYSVASFENRQPDELLFIAGWRGVGCRDTCNCVAWLGPSLWFVESRHCVVEHAWLNMT